MENVTNAPVLGKKGTFPATVAKVIDDYKLVINRGSEHGIREDQRMLVYCVSDEDIKDPNTGESLGYLELVRGTGKIIFLQEKIAILESDKVQYIRTRLPAWVKSGDPRVPGEQIIEEPERMAFEDPQVGDQVKPI